MDYSTESYFPCNGESPLLAANMLSFFLADLLKVYAVQQFYNVLLQMHYPPQHTSR